MSIWFFVWLALSGALLYFLGWTLYILYRQKSAWKAYALKMKLRYNPRQLLSSPDISGIVYGHTVSVFSSEHMAADGRGTRKLTAIEVHLSSRMPFEAGIASGGMVDLIRGLRLKEEMRPASPDWEDSWIAAANFMPALESYLTPERVAAIVALMKMKNAWVIILFRNDVALLRVDTPDPLDDPRKLDVVLKRMTETAKILELSAGEDARLKAAAAVERSSRQVSVKISDKAVSGNAGLSLEDEPPAE